MAADPKGIADVNQETIVESDDDTVPDPALEPYDETVEKPNRGSENFIPPEEL